MSIATRPFVVLWLSAFTFFLSFLLLLSALPIFARRLGASDAAIGLIMASFAVSSLILRPPTGWAADRFGRRPFMVTGALVFTVASVACGWAGGALCLVLVRLLHGCGMGLYPTAASAMEIGIAIGSLSSGLAVGRWGFVTTFLATAAIAWAAGVLALLGPRPRLAT